MASRPLADARWPSRLAELHSVWLASTGAGRDAHRARLWLALNAALFGAARAQAGRFPRARREDLEDVAASKALELLGRAEEGMWDPRGRPDHEIAGYIARVARNGLVDLARRSGREVPLEEPGPEGWTEDAGASDRIAAPAPDPADRAHAREFAGALRDCVEKLQPRARRVWSFRVFHEMSSREIAAHPRIGVKPAHVDVIVQRAREALRGCMGERGHDGLEVRAGVFAELWPLFERDGMTDAEAGRELSDERND